MLSGHQSYRLEVGGFHLIELPLIDLTFPAYPGVDKAEVSSTGERRIEVKVTFKQVASAEDAASIAEIIATQIADRLAFEYKISVNDPVKGEASLTRRDSPDTVHILVSHHVPVSIAGHDTKTIAPGQVPQLKSVLVSDEPNKDAYYSQLRWILRQDNPVARFMHLYKILLSLQGGTKHTQPNVDAFITSQEPGVQAVFNPHLKRTETIYSRLRNEVGHEIAGTTPDSTRQGMEQHMDKLIDHVKAAISRIP